MQGYNQLMKQPRRGLNNDQTITTSSLPDEFIHAGVPLEVNFPREVNMKMFLAKTGFTLTYVKSPDPENILSSFSHS